MKNQNLAEHLPLNQRAGFLRDNADAVETLNYLKKFTPEEIQEMKNNLSNVSIEINDIENERKDAVDVFKSKLKPLVIDRKETLTNIRNKAISVKEDCFKFIDHDTNTVSYYNNIGDLVDQRPIMPSERQKSIFSIEKNGTND